jgi:hypothetical protein
MNTSGVERRKAQCAAAQKRHREKMNRGHFELKAYVPRAAVHQLDRLAIACGVRRADVVRAMVTDPMVIRALTKSIRLSA